MSSLSSVTMAPSLMGPPATLGQCDVGLPPALTLRLPWRCFSPACVPQQQPPSSLSLQGYVNYAMGSAQVGFFFRVEPPTILYIICLVSVLVFVFYFSCHAGCCFHPWELNHWGLHHATLWSLPMAGICATWWWSWPTPGMHRVVAAPSTTLSREGTFATQSPVPQVSYLYGGAYSFGAWFRVTWSFYLHWMVGRRLLFQVWLHLMTQSTLNLQ